jgi:hypothetical protein
VTALRLSRPSSILRRKTPQPSWPNGPKFRQRFQRHHQSPLTTCGVRTVTARTVMLWWGQLVISPLWTPRLSLDSLLSLSLTHRQQASLLTTCLWDFALLSRPLSPLSPYLSLHKKWLFKERRSNDEKGRVPEILTATRASYQICLPETLMVTRTCYYLPAYLPAYLPISLPTIEFESTSQPAIPN